MGIKRKYVSLLLIGFTALFLSACENADDILLFKNVGDPALFEDDVVIGTQRSDVDIEVSNAEQVMIDTMEGVLALHQMLPLFDVLDSVGLDLNYVGDIDSRQVFATNCSGSGQRIVSRLLRSGADLELDAEYTEGDHIRVEYVDCVEGGHTYSGSIELTYDEIEGFNNLYRAVNTEHCIARIAEEHDVLQTDRISSNGDSLLFEPFGEDLRVLYINFDSSDSRGYVVADSFIVTQNRPVIATLQPNEINASALTSLDGGDIVYLLEGVSRKVMPCQTYSRELSAQLSGFKVSGASLSFSLNGNITLHQVSEALTDRQNTIRDSDFNLVVDVLDGDEVIISKSYDFDDYTSVYSNQDGGNGYELRADGYIHSDQYYYVDSEGHRSGGRVLKIETPIDLQGIIDNKFPLVGTVQLLGQGVERIRAISDGSEVLVTVDRDGVENIKDVSEAEEAFFTTWARLDNREFENSDFVIE